MNAVPELIFTMLPPPCARISGTTACIATTGPNTLSGRFRQKRGIDLLLLWPHSCALHCLRDRRDAAVMPAHGAYLFSHAIKLRHVYRDRQAAWKLSRQFLQRIGAASEQRDFRPALVLRAIAVDNLIPDEAPVTMKTRSSICIVRSSYSIQPIFIDQRPLSPALQRVETICGAQM